MRRCHENRFIHAVFFVLVAVAVVGASGEGLPLELSGLTVTPHLKLDSMRYAKEPEPAEGARVQMFFRNAQPEGSVPLKLRSDVRFLFEGQPPEELLASGAWAWHDTPSADPELELTVPAGGLVVWSFNGRRLPFGAGGEIAVELGANDRPLFSGTVRLPAPTEWIAAATFLATDDVLHPDQLWVHVTNEGDTSLELVSVRLWLPVSSTEPFVLQAQDPIEDLRGFGNLLSIPPHDKGGFAVVTPPLPRTYAAIEITARRARIGNILSDPPNFNKSNEKALA